MEIEKTIHPLLGSLVNFLGNPKFEGRNDILTKEGEEADSTN